VAKPLELELWIGLPAEHEHRVARLHRTEGYAPTALAEHPDPPLEVLYGNLGAEFVWNDEAVHQAEIPAANAIGTARSMAQLYGNLERILSAKTIELGRTELSRDLCAVTGRPYAFGVGFELQTELYTLGPPPAAFGHTGSAAPLTALGPRKAPPSRTR
jgi:Beta-lactamase